MTENSLVYYQLTRTRHLNVRVSVLSPRRPVRGSTISTSTCTGRRRSSPHTSLRSSWTRTTSARRITAACRTPLQTTRSVLCLSSGAQHPVATLLFSLLFYLLLDWFFLFFIFIFCLKSLYFFVSPQKSWRACKRGRGVRGIISFLHVAQHLSCPSQQVY